MSILEIISGGLLILASLIIIFMVLVQQPSGSGLSGAIGGGEALTSREVDEDRGSSLFRGNAGRESVRCVREITVILVRRYVGGLFL